MAKRERKTTNTSLLLLALALVAGLLVGFQLIKPMLDTKGAQVVNPKGEQIKLTVGETTLMVEVRDDEKERELGLSGREHLGENEGMLFIFPQAERQLFWMKDMLFSIDVLWIANGVVADIATHVKAPTTSEPKIETIVSTMPVDMVLEVPAGWVETHQVAVGDQVKR